MKKAFIIVVVASMALSIVSMSTYAQDSTETVPYSWLSECETDLTGETLTFYHFGDLSGPYAFISQPLVAGLEDAITLLNDNGGLCGATVVQEFRDTGGAQDQSQAFWDEFSVKDDAYSVYLYASADGELLRTQSAEAGIVLFNAAGSELALFGEENQPGWQFTVTPLYVDQFGAFCDYIAENWDSLGIEGDPVIGHLSWEGSFGRASDTEITRAYCEEKGIGYAGAEYFLPGTPDISVQLQKLLDGGANIIYTTSLASGPAQVAGTITASEANVIMGGVNWALDSSVMALGGEATNGIIGNVPYLWWDEVELAPVQIVSNYWLENRLSQDPEGAVRLRNIAYFASYGTFDLWAEVMIQTINRVGFENLSGEAVYETTQEIQYEPFLGMLKVDFTEGRRSGNFTRIGQIQFLEANGAVAPSVVPLTEWINTPDLHPMGE